MPVQRFRIFTSLLVLLLGVLFSACASDAASDREGVSSAGPETAKTPDSAPAPNLAPTLEALVDQRLAEDQLPTLEALVDQKLAQDLVPSLEALVDRKLAQDLIPTLEALVDQRLAEIRDQAEEVTETDGPETTPLQPQPTPAVILPERAPTPMQRKEILALLRQFNTASNYFESATGELEDKFAWGNESGFTEYLHQMNEHWLRIDAMPTPSYLPEFEELKGITLSTWESASRFVSETRDSLEQRKPENVMQFRRELLRLSYDDVMRAKELQEGVLEKFDISPVEVNFRPGFNYGGFDLGAAEADLEAVQVAMYTMMAERNIYKVTPYSGTTVSTATNDWNALPTGSYAMPLVGYLPEPTSRYFYCYDASGLITWQSIHATPCPVEASMYTTAPAPLGATPGANRATGE